VIHDPLDVSGIAVTDAPAPGPSALDVWTALAGSAAPASPRWLAGRAGVAAVDRESHICGVGAENTWSPVRTSLATIAPPEPRDKRRFAVDT